jgi:hypothetical protein
LPATRFLCVSGTKIRQQLPMFLVYQKSKNDAIIAAIISKTTLSKSASTWTNIFIGAEPN